jgi:hypothetical protein
MVWCGLASRGDLVRHASRVRGSCYGNSAAAIGRWSITRLGCLRWHPRKLRVDFIQFHGVAAWSVLKIALR